MRISISICPTNLEVGDDVMNEDKYLGAIEEVVRDKWPNAIIDTLQIGYNQGDEWFRLNGKDSDDLMNIVHSIDTSDESLYDPPNNEV